MPAEIVTQTCPAPKCDLSEKDVSDFWKNWRTTWNGSNLISTSRATEAQHSLFPQLAGHAMRKNVEQMALGFGEKVRSLQYFVGQSPWEAEPVLGIHQQVVGETLGEEDGVALIDESSAVKQGDAWVGVAAQYCGSVGKVANGQVGVYLGYASRKGYSLVEGQLFMPDEWFEEDQAERRKACGVPEDLVYKTKPEIGLELLQKAKKRGNLSFSWVAADALYGNAPLFGMELPIWTSGISPKSSVPPRFGAPNPKCIFPNGRGVVVVQPACVCVMRANIRFRSKNW